MKNSKMIKIFDGIVNGSPEEIMKKLDAKAREDFLNSGIVLVPSGSGFAIVLVNPKIQTYDQALKRLIALRDQSQARLN